ncbi:VanZ family protein [Dehalobacter sp. DCM]|uniref:VanZ family protein n=1 Tax=Dehalobacter sp. DCM TaxID=2907827 RepID=UPI003081314D|nr:VanZ family protein [Dehalobacter sp. DCM]
MRIIVYYIKDMLPVMVMALPIVFIVRVIAVKVRKKQRGSHNWYHEIGLGIFVLFLTGLASQTIVPVWGISLEGPEMPGIADRLSSINLIPFQALIIIARIISNGGIPEREIVQLFGNIGMFIVPGFMLPLLWRSFQNMSKTVLVCALISFTIEFTQLFTGRSTDIDDLLLNTLGGILGFLIFAAVKRSALAKISERFHSIPRESIMTKDKGEV